jgi:pimeloyl-ACP methyl ester carboxylesterase
MGNGYRTAYKSDAWETALLEEYDAALRRWPVVFEELEIKTPAAKTHILLCGNPQGKPLLLFHGTGNNSLTWKRNVEGLGEMYRLYLVDTPNDPGKSAAAADFRPPESYTQWMRELLAALDLPEVSLLGHSKGGWLALNTVIHMPDQIDKVVLLAPTAGLISRLDPVFIRKSLKVGLFPTEKNVANFMQYISARSKELDAKYVKYLTDLIKGMKTRPIPHREFTDAELQAIQNPVLLIFGEQERSLDHTKVIRRAEDHIPNLKTVTVTEAGHALQGEKPEEINRLIKDFI